MGRTAQIDVVEGSSGVYDVDIDEFISTRSFRVTLTEETFQKLSNGRSKEQFVRDAFRFLLTREPKESILEHFDIGDIVKYFPEFEREI